jgi:hypothetical protein
MIQLKILYYSNDLPFEANATYWINLVTECREKCTGGRPSEIWTHIHAELAKYNATFKDFMLEFEDEQYLSMFILRFS